MTDLDHSTERASGVARGDGSQTADGPAVCEPFATALAPGTVIDARFVIDKKIGAGGMSAVYRARHTKFDRIVALKMLHPHLVQSRSSLERFLLEAKAESSVKHKNVLAVQTVGVTEGGELYMVMDYLEGRSLAEAIAPAPLPAPRAVPIFIEICAGLAAAHDANILHRDLKPSNIMLCRNRDGAGSRDSEVKIVDFGIAKLLTADQRITQAGSVLGSPTYMSPEQCQGEKLDARSDIYSLGCLMYEVLTGRPPFEANNELETLYQHLQSAPPPFADKAPNMVPHPELESIVLKCLEKAPERRYQSVRELQSDLEALDLTVPPAAATTPVRSFPAKTRTKFQPGRRFYGAACGITVVLLAAAAQPAATAWQEYVVAPRLKSEALAALKNKDKTAADAAKVMKYADLLWRLHQLEARGFYLEAIRSGVFANLPGTTQLPLYERAFADRPEAYVGALSTLNMQLMQRGEYAQAVQVAELELRVANTVMQESSPGLSRLIAARDWATALDKTGRGSDAEGALDDALKNWRTIPFKNELIASFDLAGNIAMKSSNFHKAIEHFDRELQLSGPPGDDSSRLLRTAQVQHCMGLSRFFVHEDAEAEKHFKNEIALLREVHGIDVDVKVCEALRAHGEAIAGGGNYQRALPSYYEAIDVVDRSQQRNPDLRRIKLEVLQKLRYLQSLGVAIQPRFLSGSNEVANSTLVR